MEQKQNVQTPQSWAEVVINSGLSVDAVIEFLNVLNQRLSTLENIVTVPDENGEHHSITEIYRAQTQMQENQDQEQVERSQPELLERAE